MKYVMYFDLQIKIFSCEKLLYDISNEDMQ